MVFGGYLFSRPRLPQCGKVVQRRRRSSNSLPYWISCSLHRPPDALTVDPITSPWLFDLARKIPTHQRPKKNTMRCMVFFFGIRRLPIFCRILTVFSSVKSACLPVFLKNRLSWGLKKRLPESCRKVASYAVKYFSTLKSLPSISLMKSFARLK